MKLENRKGLGRGVVTVEQRPGTFEDIKAYTFWFRHDERNLNAKLEHAIDKLCRAYSYDSYNCGTMVIGVEWREYRG